ncbi:hypothetical protein GJ496_007136 [Pomphorhynchus laevis]|nr:hypothetical protein GJ496_007136 [Pomphorhynchus laevis]
MSVGLSLSSPAAGWIVMEVNTLLKLLTLSRLIHDTTQYHSERKRLKYLRWVSNIDECWFVLIISQRLDGL